MQVATKSALHWRRHVDYGDGWDRGNDRRAELLECHGGETLWQAAKCLCALADTDMCDKDVVIIEHIPEVRKRQKQHFAMWTQVSPDPEIHEWVSHTGKFSSVDTRPQPFSCLGCRL